VSDLTFSPVGKILVILGQAKAFTLQKKFSQLSTDYSKFMNNKVNDQ
jgi:hypothetical protein